jgi:hypothetical protein
VRLAITSKDGKEAIAAILDAGEFFGERCRSFPRDLIKFDQKPFRRIIYAINYSL